MAEADQGFEAALTSALHLPYLLVYHSVHVLNQLTESFTGYFDACAHSVYQALSPQERDWIRLDLSLTFD